MPPETFIESVINAYFSARELSCPHPKVSRCESRSIHSEVVEKFACLLAQRNPQIEHIHIGQRIKHIPGNRVAGFTPDLIVSVAGKARLLVELVINTQQYQLPLTGQLERFNDLAAKTKGRTIQLFTKPEAGYSCQDMTFSNDLKYVIVTLCDKPKKSGRLWALESAAAKLENTALFPILNVSPADLEGVSIAQAIAKAKQNICLNTFAELDRLIPVVDPSTT